MDPFDVSVGPTLKDGDAGMSRTGLTAAVEPYRALMKDFVGGTISATDFAAAFQRQYLASTAELPFDVFDELERVFIEAEFVEPDDAERAEAYIQISPEQLLATVKAVLERAGY